MNENTPSPLTTVADVIDAFEGTHATAAILGVSVQAICNMRSRGAFPPRHYQALIGAAAERKIPGITLELLSSLQARSTGTTIPPSHGVAA